MFTRWLWVPTVLLAAGCHNAPLPLNSSPVDSGLPGIVVDASAAEPPAVSTPRTCSTLRPQSFVLSNAQYNATVRDLLGDTSQPANKFDADSVDQRAFLLTQETPSPPKQAQLEAAADALATTAASHLADFLPCDPVAVGGDACLQQFVDSFALRAFRRPVTADERSRLLDAGAQATGGAFADRARAVIAAALKSPHFYRLELEQSPDRLAALDDYQFASRLSYFIYGSMPDVELLAAAAEGRLKSTADRAAQVQRMLQDPKGHLGLRALVDRWLGLDGLASLNRPGSTDPAQMLLYSSMREETLRFVDDTFYGNGGVRELMHGATTWLNSVLADVYGVAGITGFDFQQARVDPTVRSGLLTQASLLTMTSFADRTSISRRGTFMLQRFFCYVIPPPPPGISLSLDRKPGETSRQALARDLASNPVCAACHVVTDPIGFALETFDTIGRHRTTMDGLAIDTSGTLSNAAAGPLSFRDAVELGDQLGKEPGVADCIGTHWVKAAIPELVLDDSSTCAPQSILRSSTGTLRSLVDAIVRSESFQFHAGCARDCQLNPAPI